MVDCADFYRALHQAIVQAKHSIFILGWEIDSAIELLRGEDKKKANAPTVAADLLAWKAKQNPQLKIYLLRWESSVFIDERELMAEQSWATKTPENVHICLDNMIPLGGSQHQKIILVDDQIAFSGGMDLARQRWDERQHRIVEPDRVDISGAYGPYHDVQIMLDGPVAKALAELARWRWQRAAGYPAIAIRATDESINLSAAWPKHWPVDFQNVPLAIARTIPAMEDHAYVQEVQQMYLDLIAQAENFIYIENQFATCEVIAQALNQQLKHKPNLQVLLISSFNPQGFFETEGMWAARIDFKKILYKGIDHQRVRMAYSKIEDQSGQAHYQRIHSKILVIDDKYLTVGSANLNNRSMALDTECDIVLFGDNKVNRRKIAEMRNELIVEHSGHSPQQIHEIFNRSHPLIEIFKFSNPKQYHLREINDKGFTKQRLKSLVRKFADPRDPLINVGDSKVAIPLRNPSRNFLLFLGLASILILVVGAFLINKHNQWLSAEQITLFLERSRQSRWALLAVCLIYVVAGFVFFPVTVLSLLVAATFGPLWGPAYGMCGALLSAAVMFWIGHLMGFQLLRRLLGERLRKLDYHMQRAGIWGVALIRFLPLAPYSLVNLAAGMSAVRFLHFMIGSFIGFFPALVIKGLVGDSLVQAFLNPTPKTTHYLILGIVAWLFLIFLSYCLSKRYGHFPKRSS